MVNALLLNHCHNHVTKKVLPFIEPVIVLTNKFMDVFQVLGYPSKPIGLFIRRSIIFRSDSNGEDLEGYAGAGLYDR